MGLIGFALACAALAVPESLDQAEQRVRAMAGRDAWREALAAARQMQQAFPDEPRARAALAEALFRAGELEQVAPLLAPAAAAGQLTGRGWMVLARVREAEGRAGEAVELMGRAVAAAPDDPTVLYWAGGTAADRDQAIWRLERYLELSAVGAEDPDRLQAARGSLEVLRALGDRRVWIAADPPERATIPLRRVWDEGSGTTLGFVVEARIGERARPVRLLLDSGSAGLLLVERLAQRNGFAPVAERISYGAGAQGRRRVRRGFFEQLRLGPLRFTDVLATTSREEVDPLGRFHGYLGLSVFAGYSVTLDFARGLLTLTPLPERAQGGVPYWTVEGQWLVRARTRSAERDGLFLLDTGQTRTLVASAFLRDLPGAILGPALELRGVGGAIAGARTLAGVEVVFEELSAGPSGLCSADLGLGSRMAGVEISGRLGLDLLGSSRLAIDPRHRRLRVVGAD